MASLVEIHDKEDLEKVLKTKATIIGINNRNLDSLRVKMDTVPKLIKKIPKNKLVIAESGYKTKKDINKIKKKVDAVLIGSAFMQAKDIEKKIKELK